MVVPDPWPCAKMKDRHQQAEIVGMERNSLFSDRWSVASVGQGEGKHIYTVSCSTEPLSLGPRSSACIAGA